MGFFKSLFKSQPSVPSTSWKEYYAKAEAAMRNDDFTGCMLALGYAADACRTRDDKMEFYSVQGAPGHPTGAASLADAYAIHKKDTMKCVQVLDFIVTRAGNDKGLCEVWFSLYQEALIQQQFQLARIAHEACLHSQLSLGKYIRIDRALLKERFESAPRAMPYGEFMALSPTPAAR